MEIKSIDSRVCGCEQFQDQENGYKWWTYCFYHGRIQQQQYDEMSKRLSFAHNQLSELRWTMEHPEA